MSRCHLPRVVYHQVYNAYEDKTTCRRPRREGRSTDRKILCAQTTGFRFYKESHSILLILALSRYKIERKILCARTLRARTSSSSLVLSSLELSDTKSIRALNSRPPRNRFTCPDYDRRTPTNPTDYKVSILQGVSFHFTCIGPFEVQSWSPYTQVMGAVKHW